jgi:hypothetical protein
MPILPWSVYVLTAFGIIYGWILSRAALDGIYRITGIRLLDAYILSWILGLAAGYTPVCLYLAFGFHEFKEPFGLDRRTQQLHWAGRAEVVFFILYTVFILATVKQHTDQSATQDLGQVILLNIAFAFVALFFAALKGLIDQRK